MNMEQLEAQQSEFISRATLKRVPADCKFKYNGKQYDVSDIRGIKPNQYISVADNVWLADACTVIYVDSGQQRHVGVLPMLEVAS